jgi:hypothetical protein
VHSMCLSPYREIFRKAAPTRYCPAAASPKQRTRRLQISRSVAVTSHYSPSLQGKMLYGNVRLH